MGESAGTIRNAACRGTRLSPFPRGQSQRGKNARDRQAPRLAPRLLYPRRQTLDDHTRLESVARLRGQVAEVAAANLAYFATAAGFGGSASRFFSALCRGHKIGRAACRERGEISGVAGL